MRFIFCCCCPLLLVVPLMAAEPAPIELVAVPSSVSRSLNLNFQDGKLRGGQDSLQISLTAKLGERLRLVEVADVTVLEAIGDDGKPLPMHSNSGSGGGGGDLGRIDLYVQLTPPAASVRSLRSLVVSARAHVAAETLRRAALKPAKDWIAKRMRIDGIEGGEIELENLGAESLTLGLTPELEKVFENLSFKNAAGDDVEHRGWNDSQEPGWIARVVEVALPGDGSILLDLRQTLGERRFILRAKDVPLALPDRSKNAVGTLKTEEVKEGEPVTPLEGQPLPAAIDPHF